MKFKYLLFLSIFFSIAIFSNLKNITDLAKLENLGGFVRGHFDNKLNQQEQMALLDLCRIEYKCKNNISYPIAKKRILSNKIKLDSIWTITCIPSSAENTEKNFINIEKGKSIKMLTIQSLGYDECKNSYCTGSFRQYKTNILKLYKSCSKNRYR